MSVLMAYQQKHLRQGNNMTVNTLSSNQYSSVLTCKLVEVIIPFRVLFGVYSQERVFQKAEIAQTVLGIF